MKFISFLMLCALMPWHIAAQNLQVIPQWIARQVNTEGNTQVVSSVGAMTSVSDVENGVILTSYLLNIEEIEDTTGTSTLTDKIGLRVYPNPTPDVINLSRSTWNEELLVTITDANGKLLRTATWRSGIMQLQLYVNHASSGYYMLQVADSSQTNFSTFKVLKH